MGYNEVVLAHCLSITLMVISFKHAYLQPAMGYIHLYIQSQLNVGNLINVLTQTACMVHIVYQLLVTYSGRIVIILIFVYV